MSFRLCIVSEALAPVPTVPVLAYSPEMGQWQDEMKGVNVDFEPVEIMSAIVSVYRKNTSDM